MTIQKEKKGNIMIYHLDKVISDEAMEKLKNTFVKPSQIKLIINHDADVYTADNKLLFIYRKNKLDTKKLDEFYDAIIKFAMTETSNRGSASASKAPSKNVRDNPRIKSNIFGYFEKFAPKQKMLLREAGMKNLLDVRETRFNMDYPEQYKRTLPLIKQIDDYYKKYIPEKYKLQRKKANQTHFRIQDTSFTTVTTNVNFQTSIHKDKGDDAEGFGNLVVIEKGKYDGAETCFPQYGVGVDLRFGDILFMDVHQWHGNLPMKKIDKDAIRLSIVCYLRYNIWVKTKGKSKDFMIKHNKTIKNLRRGRASDKNKTRKKWF
jgi:hypothetical protein